MSHVLRPHRYTRRSLLARLGGAAAYVPLLQSARVLGATASAPRRLLIVAWPGGVLPSAFWPTGGETDFAISTATDSPLLPLVPYRNDIVILGGLDNNAFIALGKGGAHAASPTILTGALPVTAAVSGYDALSVTAGGQSVDLFIADAIAKQVKLPLHSLQLQTNFLKADDRYISYRGGPIGGRPNAPTPETDVYKLFDRLFAGRMLPQAGAPVTLTPVRNHRKSVLDYVGRSLTTLAQNLGTEDRRKIEQHLNAVRETEQLLTSPPPTGMTGPGCRAVAPPAMQKNFTAPYSQFLDQGQQLQADMVIAAFACDLTRVATLYWGDSSNSTYAFWWLGSDFVSGHDRDNGGTTAPVRQHHEIVHSWNQDADRTRRKNLVDQWFFSNLAHILGQLRAVPEGGGTMLDNTLVCFLNIASAEPGGHGSRDMPWVLGGRAGGALETGRFLRSVSGSGAHLPHNALLTEICNMMDVPVAGFGDMQFRAAAPRIRG